MTGDRNAAIDRFVASAMADAHKGKHPSRASMRRLYAELSVARDPYVVPEDDDEDQDQDQDQDQAGWPPTSVRSPMTTRSTAAGLQAPGQEQERP